MPLPRPLSGAVDLPSAMRWANGDKGPTQMLWVGPSFRCSQLPNKLPGNVGSGFDTGSVTSTINVPDA